MCFSGSCYQFSQREVHKEVGVTMKGLGERFRTIWTRQLNALTNECSTGNRFHAHQHAISKLNFIARTLCALCTSKQCISNTRLTFLFLIRYITGIISIQRTLWITPISELWSAKTGTFLKSKHTVKSKVNFTLTTAKPIYHEIIIC